MQESASVIKDSRHLVRAVVCDMSDEDWWLWASEFEGLSAQLAATDKSAPLRYREHWAVEDDSAMFLYACMRFLKPEVVVETGLANGHSTFYLLNALSKNACGHLHSVDVSSDVGSLVGMVNPIDGACTDSRSAGCGRASIYSFLPWAASTSSSTILTTLTGTRSTN